MAHEYTTWAWRMPDLPYSEKLVLLHLADAASHEGVCWPGMQRMQRQTCLGERTIRRALRALEQRGLLATEARYSADGSRSSNLYRLPASVVQAPPATEPPPPGHKTPTPPGHSGPRTVSSTEPPVEPTPPTPPTGLAVGTAPPAGAGKRTARNGSVDEGEAAARVVAAYNEHRGTLPEVKVINRVRRRKVSQAIRDLGSVDEVAAAMAVAAAEVAEDDWWTSHGYGFDNLLADQRFVAKAEAAMNRGTTDRSASRAKSIADAVADL